MGSWRVVDESGRHVRRERDTSCRWRVRASRARRGSEHGPGRGRPGRLRVGRQAPKQDASVRSGRVLERMLSGPRAPGKGRPRCEGDGNSVFEGRAKEKAHAESTPGRLEAWSGSGWKGIVLERGREE